MLEGFTVERAAGLSAVVVSNSASPTLQHCTIRDSTSDTRGGGLRVDSATLEMRNCTVSGNLAAEGGGGLSLSRATGVVRLEAVVISNNSAGGSATADATRGGGGGILAVETELSLLDANVSDNTARSDGGGGVKLSGNLAETFLTVSHCVPRHLDGQQVRQRRRRWRSLRIPRGTDCKRVRDPCQRGGRRRWARVGGHLSGLEHRASAACAALVPQRKSYRSKPGGGRKGRRVATSGACQPHARGWEVRCTPPCSHRPLKFASQPVVAPPSTRHRVS